ncbi:MAG: 50S ribosomal protein L9 [Ardenticatenaceae bacterium]|nr:50S ribosomal protein L9 [Ardenticatenaceae bacterium]MCB9446489.1 50S ribosomal protein L9 [Ardenticatenaceae bacterium]
MKVLLKEDVDNLGFAGEVHKVAPGYARNFLIPKGMAIKADPGAMKQAEVWRRRAETRRAELKAEFEALSAKIQEVTLTFKARAGETGKLYGSITTAQIADDLNEKLGTEIDRRKVGVEPLRMLGKHKVVVRLSGEFQPEFTVIIEDEDTMAAAARASAAAASAETVIEVKVEETEEATEEIE